MPVLEIMIHRCDFDFGRNQHVIFYLRFHPSLPKSLQPDCILIDEMRRVDIGDDGEPGWRHLSRFDEAATAHKVLLAPVAVLAARREALYGLPVVNALHGTVNPPETQSHLNGIDVADHTWVVRFRTVDAQPEVSGLIVVFNVPPIKFLSGMDVKQRGDFHWMFFYGAQCSIVMVTFCFSTSPSADNISVP